MKPMLRYVTFQSPSLSKKNTHRTNVLISFCVIQVFYVDYGNCGQVALRNVFLWEERWDHIPFQAYRCRMDGIKKIEDNDMQSTKKFKSIIYNKRLNALIT